MRLPALDLDAGRALAIPRASELCDRHGLVELGHGPEHLPDQPRRWGILDEGVRTVGGDQLDAALLEHGVADLLNPQVARKAVRRLDQDGPDAVALDALQHGREAGALVDGVSTAHSGVEELVHDHEACAPGEARDGVPLALVAVLIGP